MKYILTQAFYRRDVMTRFMTDTEMKAFEDNYQSVKAINVWRKGLAKAKKLK